jgi:hypothetical protein
MIKTALRKAIFLLKCTVSPNGAPVSWGFQKACIMKVTGMRKGRKIGAGRLLEMSMVHRELDCRPR